MHLYQLILIIVIGVLIYNIFDVEDIPKKPIKSKRLNNKKKVTFNLYKNNVFEFDEPIISNINETKTVRGEKKNNNDETSYDKKLIDETTYGNKLIDEKSNFNIKNIKIENPQDTLVKRLQKKSNEKNEINKENEFQNDDSYWNSLNLGNFTERDFLNKQVNEFNNFKSNGVESNVEIGKLYDELTNGKTNPLPTIFEDNDIDPMVISGYSSNCNNLILNNIEN